MIDRDHALIDGMMRPERPRATNALARDLAFEQRLLGDHGREFVRRQPSELARQPEPADEQADGDSFHGTAPKSRPREFER
jgi:hypothetical protein